MLEPNHVVFRGGVSLAGLLLVLPVSGDTKLSTVMHLAGTNLNLHGSSTGANDGGVKRLIKIKFRHRDVILEAARNRIPSRVN